MVEDLSKEELAEGARIDECKVSELVTVKDCAATDLAYLIAGHLESGDTEMFAGSGIFARFTKASFVRAKFVTEKSR